EGGGRREGALTGGAVRGREPPVSGHDDHRPEGGEAGGRIEQQVRSEGIRPGLLRAVDAGLAQGGQGDPHPSPVDRLDRAPARRRAEKGRGALPAAGGRGPEAQGHLCSEGAAFHPAGRAGILLPKGGGVLEGRRWWEISWSAEPT